MVEFIRDNVAVLGLFVSITTMLALLVQLRISTEQARRASNLNFLSESESRAIEGDLDAYLVDLGLGSIAERRNRPLELDEARVLLGDPGGCGAANALLNHLNNLAVARDHRIVDRKIFEAVHEGRLRWWATLLESYIVAAREEFNEPAMWASVLKLNTAR